MSNNIFIAGLMIALLGGAMVVTSYKMTQPSENENTTHLYDEEIDMLFGIFCLGIIFIVIGLFLIFYLVPRRE